MMRDGGDSGVPKPGRSQTSQLVGLAAAVLALALLAGTGFVAWNSHARAVAEASRGLRNLSLVLAEHAERALQAVEIADSAVIGRMMSEGVDSADGLRSWAAAPRVHRLLRERSDQLPQVDALLILDAAGRIVASSRNWPPSGADLAYTDCFRALSAGASRHVSLPVLSPVKRDWVMHIGLGVTSPDGAFIGAVIGVVELGWFERFHADLALAPGSSIALFHADGTMLTRFPKVEAEIGRSFADAPSYAIAAATLDGTPRRLASHAEGVEQLVIARALEAVPIRLHVGLSMDSALADWHAQLRWLAAGTVLLLATLGGALAAALRQLRSRAAEQTARAASAEARARLAEEQARRERELAEQAAGFRVAVEGMSQGLLKFGRDGRLALSNGRCGAIIGVPEAALQPGVGFGDVLAAAAAQGGGTARAAMQLAEVVAGGAPASFVCDLGEGRAAGVTYQPLPDGGWIATFEDVSERRRAEAQVEHMARHDALTGLPNRLMFDERVSAALGAAARSGGRVAVLSLDIDHFKAVNDSLGHALGDALLRAATARILGTLRAGEMVARLGSDEFVLAIGPGAVQPCAAAALAERLISTLSEPFLLEGHQVVVGGSVGVAISPGDGDRAPILLKNAQLALGRAKQEGRGQVRFFEAGMDARVQSRRQLELDLRHALSAHAFELHYQPVVEVETRRPTGFEALLRWRHPERGMVPPAEFVPLAEEIGLIVPLGELVLRMACAEAANWDPALRIAVNLSPAQLRSPRFLQVVEEALADSGLDPRRVELEITEGVLLQRTEATLATLHRLRALGVRIAMDDFGTGYSSLSYLRSFPFDKVKIDRAFVSDLETRRDDAAIVQAVIGLCSRLGMTTTAEGVETEEQLRRLATERCMEAQGYLFSHPVPAAEIPALLQRLSGPRRVMAAR